MAYTNSPLATYTRLTSHHSGQRTHSIDRISPHCIVGFWTAPQTVNYFATTDIDASCNYAIGKDGDIALGVEEKNRSWCTSSNANDQRAITIECASDTKHPYTFQSATYNALIKLCVDICKRNGKNKLIWIADKNTALAYEPKAGEMLITVHRWFANKACPGDWLYNRLGDLAAKVTAQLGGASFAPTPTAPTKPEAPTTNGADNEKKIWDALIATIVNPFGVAGLMGNLYAESGLRPENLQNTYEKSLNMTDAQYTAAVDAGTYSKDSFVHDKAGYGLAQWTYYSRKQAMFEDIKGKQKSIGDLDAQIAFLLKEIAGYKTVYGTLKNATTVRQASDAVLTGYERPADQSESVQAKRAAYGQVYFDKYAKTPAPTPNTDKEAEQRAAVVAQARKWLGITEPNHGEILNVYNNGLPAAIKKWGTRNYRIQKDDAWCAAFQSAVGTAAGLGSIIPQEVSCYYLVEIAKKNGLWVESDNYKPDSRGGDILLYDWQDDGVGDCTGEPDHVGILESVDANGNMSVIEGNYSNSVKRRTIKVGARYIRGFIVPKYGTGEAEATTPAPSASETVQWYRVRKSWDDVKSQVGAYKVYNNAVNKAKELGAEYAVYNWNGKEMFRAAKKTDPFMVRVRIDDLNIRKGPGTNYNRTGKFTGVGTFTIMEVQNGEGSNTGWGRLKSGAGWISLDYCERV